jgi:peptidoglycan hydrolase-like protein with peptidoglycan-binding domain
MDTHEIQEFLASQNYDPGEVDGIMGPRTKAAIKAFQSDHGLTPDGIVGPQTLKAIASAEQNAQPDPQEPADGQADDLGNGSDDPLYVSGFPPGFPLPFPSYGRDDLATGDRQPYPPYGHDADSPGFYPMYGQDDPAQGYPLPIYGDDPEPGYGDPSVDRHYGRPGADDGYSDPYRPVQIPQPDDRFEDENDRQPRWGGTF